MTLKSRLFHHFLKRWLKMHSTDRIVWTPTTLQIKVDFVDKPVVFPLEFPEPSWTDLARMVITYFTGKYPVEVYIEEAVE